MRNINFFLLVIFLGISSLSFSQLKPKKDEGKNLKKDEMLLTYVSTKKTAKGETMFVNFTNDKNEKVVFDWVDKNKTEVMKVFYSPLPTEDDDGNYDMTVKENVGKTYRIRWHKVKMAGDDGVPAEFKVIEGASEVTK